jgi:diacylglycerol kinase (ATP)
MRRGAFNENAAMLPMLVICNLQAGRGRARALWPEVEAGLRAAGVEFDLAVTQAPREAERLARDSVSRYRAVAAVGGDGTVHEVANGLMQAAQGAPTLPLAVVPLGSGDDFAKVIPPEAAPGGKAFGWQEAVAKIARGQTRHFDVGHMLAWADAGDTDARPLAAHYFVNGMDVGFGAQANLNLARMPGWLKGFAAYLVAILKTLLHYPRLQLRVQLDNEAPFELAADGEMPFGPIRRLQVELLPGRLTVIA